MAHVFGRSRVWVLLACVAQVAARAATVPPNWLPVDYTPPPTWTANTAYTCNLVGALYHKANTVQPTRANGCYYVAVASGTSGGTEPSWSTTDGAVFSDGSVQWQTIHPASGSPTRRYDQACKLVAFADQATWSGFRNLDIGDYGYDAAVTAGFSYTGAAPEPVGFYGGNQPVVYFAWDDQQSTAYLSGKIWGANLKPNFCYQMKLMGRPSGPTDGVGLWTKTSATHPANNRTNNAIICGSRWYDYWSDSMPSATNDPGSVFSSRRYYNGYVVGFLYFGVFFTDKNGQILSTDLDVQDANDKSTPTASDGWVPIYANRVNSVASHTRSATAVKARIPFSIVRSNPSFYTNAVPLSDFQQVYYTSETDNPSTFSLPGGTHDVALMLTEESFGNTTSTAGRANATQYSSGSVVTRSTLYYSQRGVLHPSYETAANTSPVTGTKQPVWNQTPGALTYDGTVVWQCNNPATTPVWQRTTAYTPANVIQPTTPIQLYYRPSTAAWAAKTAYTVGRVVAPTTGGNLWYRCTTAGTSGAEEPAVWNQTVGGTTSDGTVVWTTSTTAGTTAATEPTWGTWNASRTSFTPTTPVTDGTVTWALVTTWAATKKKALGDTVMSNPRNGYYFTSVGTSPDPGAVSGTSGKSQPAWNNLVGGTTIDGNIVWTTLSSAGSTSPSVWRAAATYHSSDVVVPVPTNGLFYKLTGIVNRGFSDNGEPTWATTVGYFTIDGQNVWQTLAADPTPGGSPTWQAGKLYGMGDAVQPMTANGLFYQHYGTIAIGSGYSASSIGNILPAGATAPGTVVIDGSVVWLISNSPGGYRTVFTSDWPTVTVSPGLPGTIPQSGPWRDVKGGKGGQWNATAGTNIRFTTPTAGGTLFTVTNKMSILLDGAVTSTAAGQAKIVVTDPSGNPVTGVFVQGFWSGAYQDTSPTTANTKNSGYTDLHGTLFVNTPSVTNASGSYFCFRLTTVRKAGYAWDGDPQPATLGMPSRLVWVTQPSDIVAGNSFTPAPQVAAVDSLGNIVTYAVNIYNYTTGSGYITPQGTQPVVNLVAPANYSGSLLGTSSASVDATTGLATFSGLSMTMPFGDYADASYTWTASVHYAKGSLVAPTVANGCYYLATGEGTSGGTEPTWATTVGNSTSDGSVTWLAVQNYHWRASTTYAKGSIVKPTVSTGFNYLAQAGGTSGLTEPAAWGTTPGGTTTDNTVSWLPIAPTPLCSLSASGGGVNFDHGFASNPFNVSATWRTNRYFKWSILPCNAVAGATFQSPIECTVTDQYGNLDPTATGNVTISCDYVANKNYQLSGNTSQPVINGKATFSPGTVRTGTDALGLTFRARLTGYSDLTEGITTIAAPSATNHPLEFSMNVSGTNVVTPGTWQAGRAYTKGQYVNPSSGGGFYSYRCVVAGTSGALEPAPWATGLGTTTVDGTVTWETVLRSVSIPADKCFLVSASGFYVGSGGSGSGQSVGLACGYPGRLLFIPAASANANAMGNDTGAYPAPATETTHSNSVAYWGLWPSTDQNEGTGHFPFAQVCALRKVGSYLLSLQNVVDNGAWQVNVTPGGVDRVSIVQQPPTTVQANTAFTVKAMLTDKWGNPCDTATGTISAMITRGTGNGSTSTVLTNVGGLGPDTNGNRYLNIDPTTGVATFTFRINNINGAAATWSRYSLTLYYTPGIDYVQAVTNTFDVTP